MTVPASQNASMGWGRRLRALRMDLGPFREHRDFRLLLIAGTVFYLGGMMTYVAIPFQIYQLTHSNFAVGAVGLVELGPLIVFGLYGGALADHVDRRLLLIWTGIAQAALHGVAVHQRLLRPPAASGRSSSCRGSWPRRRRCSVRRARRCSRGPSGTTS